MAKAAGLEGAKVEVPVASSPAAAGDDGDNTITPEVVSEGDSDDPWKK